MVRDYVSWSSTGPPSQIFAKVWTFLISYRLTPPWIYYFLLHPLKHQYLNQLSGRQESFFISWVAYHFSAELVCNVVSFLAFLWPSTTSLAAVSIVIPIFCIMEGGLPSVLKCLPYTFHCEVHIHIFLSVCASLTQSVQCNPVHVCS